MFNFFKRQEPAPKQKTKVIYMRSAYEAAKNNNLTFTWDTSSTAMDDIIKSNLKALRARSREQVRNNDYARRFIGLVKSNVVGQNGFVLQAKIPNDNLANDAVEKAFKQWCKRDNCDYMGRQSFVDLTRLFIGGVVEDGEILAIIHKNNAGLKLQFVDPELLDVDYNDSKLKNGNKIIHGIEYDSSMQRVAYHLLDGENALTKKYKRVDAKFILHEFVVERAGQKRGIPWMSTAMLRLNMLNKFEEAALVNARNGASKMGFYTTPDGELDGYEEDSDGTLVSEALAGTFEVLPPGVDFKTYDPAYPNGEFETFVKASLHGIASGLGINYHSLASDLSGVNYSSARIGELTDRELWRALQTWVTEAFIEPIYAIWLKYALEKKQIFINPQSPVTFTKEKFDKFSNVTWQAKRWQWVDPQKEMNAHQTAIELGLKSRSEIIREMGRDPEEVWAEIKRENEKLQEFGITPNVSQPNPQSEVNDDEEA